MLRRFRLNQFKIGTRSVGSFLLVAAITAAVGGIGYFGMRQIGAHVEQIGRGDLVGVQSLLTFKDNLNVIKAADRNLMIPRFSSERVQRQYVLIDDAWQRLDEAKTTYEALAHTPAQHELYATIAEVWPKLRAGIERSVELSKAFDQIKIREPNLVERETARVRAAHYLWLNQLNQAILAGKAFAGQLDPQACSLGKWMAAFKTENPVLRQSFADIDQPHQRIHQGGAQISRILTGPGAHAEKIPAAQAVLAEELQPAVEQMLAILDRMDAEAARAAAAYDAMQQQMNVNQQLYPPVEKVLPQLADLHAQTAAQTVDSGLAVTQRAQMLAGVAVGLGIVLAIGLGLLTTRAITRPLHDIVARIRDIAQGEGDLTKRVVVQSKDELGELGTWFNTFVQKIHDIIAEVIRSSREVAGASTQIAASSEEMAAGLRAQTSQVNQISDAIEKMNQSVRQVADQSSQAAARADESGQVATEGGQVVSQTIEDMAAINQAVSGSAASVGELGKRSAQIGKIVEVINDIADQTNLLALNAAIEAARAGEHGRGFAVVADEVRKLADRTTKATEEIAQSITAIQGETSQAVERMTAATAQVQTGAERATQAGQSLQQIVGKARQVADMIQAIAQAAEEQSSASEQVIQNVESINAVSKQSAEGAQQAAAAAAHLSNKAEQLRSLVSQFKLAEQTA
ncbi:MAG: methyl-accepting chemotaxis protein [Phycisphaeraceae bacterium]|nr:methyl-accepting chemotaxis protein [Phycisphaeraceae bacterium]